jgi:hypothetical protein
MALDGHMADCLLAIIALFLSLERLVEHSQFRAISANIVQQVLGKWWSEGLEERRWQLVETCEYVTARQAICYVRGSASLIYTKLDRAFLQDIVAKGLTISRQLHGKCRESSTDTMLVPEFLRFIDDALSCIKKYALAVKPKNLPALVEELERRGYDFEDRVEVLFDAAKALGVVDIDDRLSSNSHGIAMELGRSCGYITAQHLVGCGAIEVDASSVCGLFKYGKLNCYSCAETRTTSCCHMDKDIDSISVLVPGVSWAGMTRDEVSRLESVLALSGQQWPDEKITSVKLLRLTHTISILFLNDRSCCTVLKNAASDYLIHHADTYAIGERLNIRTKDPLPCILEF